MTQPPPSRPGDTSASPPRRPPRPRRWPAPGAWAALRARIRAWVRRDLGGCGWDVVEDAVADACADVATGVASAYGAAARFVGARLRFAGTSELAALHLAAAGGQQGDVLRSNLDLLRVVDLLFTVGGLLVGIALVLVASVARAMAEGPRWPTALGAVAGDLGAAKAVLDLATGADPGPAAFLGGTLLVVAPFACAGIRWHGPPTSGTDAVSWASGPSALAEGQEGGTR